MLCMPPSSSAEFELLMTRTKRRNDSSASELLVEAKSNNGGRIVAICDVNASIGQDDAIAAIACFKKI